MFTLGLVFTVLWTSCGVLPRAGNQPNPGNTPPSLDPAFVRQSCYDIWHQEAGLTKERIDAEFPGLIPECVGWFAAGHSGETMRAWARDRAPQFPPPVPPFAGRLRVDGRRIVTDDGEPFVWRGVTAFRLADYLADSDEAAAVAYLDWAKATGFNSVRVFTNLCWDQPGSARFTCDKVDFSPLAGERALPDVLRAARARSLYVQAVALTGTAGWGSEAAWATHARAIALSCAKAESCAYEGLNEPYHDTQARAFHDPAFAEAFTAEAVRGLTLAWTVGASEDDEALEPAGDFITRHLRRSQTNPADPIWEMWRRLREFESLSATSRRHVISGEPIGAADQDVAGRRRASPDEFYVYGVLCRVFNVGCVFHLESGLMTTLPSANERACAEAFIRGTRVIPDDAQPTFQNAHTTERPTLWRDSPVQNFNPRTASRIYSGVFGRDGITISVGSNQPAFEWGNGWQPAAVIAEASGFKVWRITQ